MAPKFKKNRKVKEKSKPKENKYDMYAPKGVKIKAFITDSFMLLMPIMYIVFYFLFDGREDFALNRLNGLIAIFMPMILIQTIFFYKWGQTPGYKFYNLTIIDNTSQKRPIFLLIFFRMFASVLSLFSLGWSLMFFRKDHKTLHDLLTDTSVVYETTVSN